VAPIVQGLASSTEQVHLHGVLHKGGGTHQHHELVCTEDILWVGCELLD
jgi:hypothetical protein